MERKYNTFWPRFAAGFCDGLILLPLKLVNAQIDDNYLTYMPILLIWEAFYLFSRPVYTFWMHGKYGQTLGKMLAGVIVLSVNENRIINYKEAIIRESPYLIAILLYLVLRCYDLLTAGISATPHTSILYSVLGYANFIWFLLELTTMLSNDKRRALHDYLAKSVIVRKEYIVEDYSEEQEQLHA